MKRIPTAKDKPLFTPGPLTTSRSVKEAMLRDLGSRDEEFIEIVQQIRDGLLEVAGISQTDGYECVLMQGSGTFGIEAVMTCAVPQGGKWLIFCNGAYGKRMQKIAEINQIEYAAVDVPENKVITPEMAEDALSNQPDVSAVAIVHCETTTGIINPIAEVGAVVKRHGKTYFIDSMSAFGAVEFDYQASQADFLVSSANKCVEGVPGFSFCIARRDKLEETAGWSRTLTLDLHAQWQGLEKNGQFRFTPPTHTMLAFHQALEELKAEGGVAGRATRYRENYETLRSGMRQLGFQEYLPENLQGHIITSFLYPDDPKFDFTQFYNVLSDRGFLIYPGKVSDAECFRIGNIGRIFPSDVMALLSAVKSVMDEMGVFSHVLAQMTPRLSLKTNG